ncbi:MAG: Ldh family oxidoreductase [Gammaproteobacteria bacterium]|nr:Ldh family oxidoreductase [Gammaproteobacteria bacterium]
MTGVTLSIEQAEALARDVLLQHATGTANAVCVARALIAAEVDGQKGHGLSRVPSYAAQAASGKVDGHAQPCVEAAVTAAVRIDAGNGFAFPAMALAVDTLAERVAVTGIAAAAVYRSHHFGQAGYHVERLAEAGMIGLVFGNSPKAIAPWGGSAGVFGTNPIAFAAPRAAGPALLIDLSLSKVARGKVMIAARQGEPIPEGWALDSGGRPTTDAAAALQGTMLPMGDAKGAALVLMVEILAAALTGARFGFEASSFFSADGEPPGVGQFLIAIDPDAFSAGGFAARLETLLDAILQQDGTRLPGERRHALREQAARAGVTIPAALFDELNGLAAGG